MSVTTVMMTALLVAVLMQPTRERLYAAAVFAQVTFYHDALFGDLESWWYYVSAGAADVLVMILLLPVSDRDRLAYQLTMLSGMSMTLNALGIFTWYHEELMEPYRWAFVTLYAWAIITMLTRHGDDNNGHVEDGGMGGVRTGVRATRVPRGDIDKTCAKPEART